MECLGASYESFPLIDRALSLYMNGLGHKGLKLFLALLITVVAWSSHCVYATPENALNDHQILPNLPTASLLGKEIEWDKYPALLYGSGKITESKLCVAVKRGWSESDLHFLFEIIGPDLTPKRENDASCVIDIYVDLRDVKTDRMERYQPGVAHLIVRLGGHNEQPPHFEQVDARNRPVENPVLASCECVVRRDSVRQFCELRIPWKAIAAFTPRPGRWIGLSTRISRIDSAPNERITVGDEGGTNDNPIESVPAAFSPVMLAAMNDFAARFWALRAEETIIRGEPWLEVEVNTLSDNVRNKGAVLCINVLPKHERYEAPFVPSPFGSSLQAIWRAQCNTNGWQGAQEVEFSIRSGGEQNSKLIKRIVPLRAAQSFSQIDAALPPSRIKLLSPEALGLAELMKACAKESAVLMTTNEGDGRLPQIRSRILFNEQLMDNQVNFFVRMAQQFIEKRRSPQESPVLAFQSRVDGEWLPIRIVYPWNYRPEKIYPATIYFYGKVKNRSRADFILADLAAADIGESYSVGGDHFSLVLYDRTEDNTGFERDNLKELFDVLIPRLNIDRRRVTVAGGSAGASAAVELAIHYPDRFSVVAGRSGSYGGIAYGDNKALENLRFTSFYLAAGEVDPGIVEASRSFAERLKVVGLTHVYEEIPATRHNFTPLPVPETIAATALPEEPLSVSLTTNSPDYGNSYWLGIGLIKDWGLPSHATARLHDGSIEINEMNVAEVIIHTDKIRQQRFPLDVVIDGRVAGRIKEGSGDKCFTYNVVGGFTPCERVAAPSLAKRDGQCGPCARIDYGPLVIIYGTKRPETARVLRERAFRILRTKLGVGDRQTAVGWIDVLPDSEALKTNLNEKNLWVIGSVEENLVRQLLESQLADVVLSLAPRSKWPADTLLSVIYPRKNMQGYLFIEEGNSIAAYSAGIMPRPNADGTLQNIDNRVIRTRSFNFDSLWKIKI